MNSSETVMEDYIMTKRAKQKLTEELKQHVSKRYVDQILDVEVLDKHRCKLTLEVQFSREPINVTLPIKSLGFEVRGVK